MNSTIPLLEDLELYSDLISSLGTHDSNRRLTPIECSDLIIRLKNETQEEWKQISKRLSLGKKTKISTLDTLNDDSQVQKFRNLQKLSRKNAYMLGFVSDKGKIPFSLGVFVSSLPNKEDHNVILKTSFEKGLRKADIEKIVSLKKKSPHIPIEEIIEQVIKAKPVIDEYYLIGITMEKSLEEKIENISKQKSQNIKDVILDLFEKRFTDNQITSVSIKNNTMFISMNQNNFEKIENDRNLNKKSITAFFNDILREVL